MTSIPSNWVIINVYQTKLTARYFTYAALVLVAYEHIITFRHEYEFLRHRAHTAATWIFTANRYLMLICGNTSAMFFLAGVIVNGPFVTSALFSALRVFALLNRAYRTAGCVLLLGLSPVGLGLLSSADTYMTSHAVSVPPRSVNLVAVLAVLAADVIACTTTWITTYRHVRQAAALGVHAGLGAELIQYGTLYFASSGGSVLCVVNMLLLVTILIVRTPLPHASSRQKKELIAPVQPSESRFSDAMDIFATV
ncbi:hypothetical protein NM688_g8057 [Phlebia brevispora]|uniref:Uncharacterized protein n=1 Tax=Phlebia brevispora TaxID=194682 RepID=A0ACC1RXU5_9APHY|nr:hypothetical protein NM688_g8057 [Phlebia brevispora]